MADRFYPLQTDYIYQLNQLNNFVLGYTGGGGGSYVLPISTSAILGGVKVGANLTVDAAGVLSATAAPQLQADWAEPSSASKAFILNKPAFLLGSVSQAFQTTRDFPLGTLVVTNIPATDQYPFLLEITGNSYGMSVPIDIKVQGYPYGPNNAFINTGGISLGQGLPGLVVFARSSVVCFWWPYQSYWQGFNIFATEVFNGNVATQQKNRVVSVTNEAKPTVGVTWEQAPGVLQALHTGSHPSVENKSSATIRGEITSANVTGALTYTPVRSAPNQFGDSSPTYHSMWAVDSRSIPNPATGIGYAGGARFRFAHTNDINSASGFADVIDLSTYGDSSGGGVNSLYLNKNSMSIVHKYAAAGATSWTAKALAYADGTGAFGTWAINVGGNAATATSAINADYAASATYWGGYTQNQAILVRRNRINSTDGTSLNTSITAPETGFSYGGSGEPVGPYITFGNLGGVYQYACQLTGAYVGGNDFKIRTRNDDVANTWNPWRTILTDGNYNTYVPTLTGGGASGAWAIDVTGKARSGIVANDDGGARLASSILPNGGGGRALRADFVTAASVGTGGNYAGALTFAPFDGNATSTGDGSYQMVFGSTTTNGGGIPRLRIRNGINITWNSFYEVLTTAINRGNYKGMHDGVVAGELMWKNYGNGHTVFDASASTTPTGTACSNRDPTNAWNPTYPTLMGFNGVDTYGVRVDRARVAEEVSALTVQTALAGQLELARADFPSLYLTDSNAGVNLGKWGFQVGQGGGQAFIGPSNDGGAVTAALTLSRDGHVALASSLTLPGAIKGASLTVTESNGSRHKSNASTTGYGAIWHNNGTDYHLLFTNNNDSDGAFNGLRPVYYNMASGNTYFGHSVILPSGNLTLNTGGISITGASSFASSVTCSGTLAVTGSATLGNTKIVSPTPLLTLNETIQAGAVGMWGIYGNGGALQIIRNTSAARDFATATFPLTISAADVVATITPEVNTNTTQVATTAFVLGQGSGQLPQALGVSAAAIGASTKWAREDHIHAVSDTGAVKLLASLNITVAAAIDFTTLFSSAFDSYTIEVNGALPATSLAALGLRWAVGGTAVVATDYLSPAITDAWYTPLDNPQNYLQLTGGTMSTGLGCTARVHLSNANSVNMKHTTTTSTCTSGTNAYYRQLLVDGFKNAGVVSGFRLFFTSGNFQATGTVRVYGHKNS